MVVNVVPDKNSFINNCLALFTVFSTSFLAHLDLFLAIFLKWGFHEAITIFFTHLDVFLLFFSSSEMFVNTSTYFGYLVLSQVRQFSSTVISDTFRA